MKTGRDVVIAALLGAEEFGFATAPLVTLGCIMMRVCHLNTCPVGVATQDPVLRKNFTGDPEHAVNFMKFIAQEVREIMAQLGFRTINEMVGRTDALEPKAAVDHWKAKGIDLSKHCSIRRPPGPKSVAIARSRRTTASRSRSTSPRCSTSASRRSSAARRSRATLPIKNINRVVGTILGNEITKRHRHGLPDDTVHLQFEGSAGQSLGAFMPKGVTIELEGDANDYVGKGLSGGRIIVYPPAGSTFVAGGQHHHRQRRALRRDRRRSLHPRHGRRTLRRAQLRRQRRRRSRRRPRLRIHDRRQGRRPRARPGATSPPA